MPDILLKKIFGDPRIFGGPDARKKLFRVSLADSINKVHTCRILV